MVDTVSYAMGRVIAGGLLAVGLLLIAPLSLIARGGQHRDWPVQSVLGFIPTLKSPEYAIVERDGQTIHFMKAASRLRRGQPARG